jgi:hypothetical protein
MKRYSLYPVAFRLEFDEHIALRVKIIVLYFYIKGHINDPIPLALLVYLG